MDLTSAEWIQVATTLFLGVVALLAPAAAEFTKRRFFAPRLKLTFQLAPPACHRTKQDLTFGGKLHSHEQAFYFRFTVSNEGKSQARQCEAVLEGLAKADAAGSFVEHSRFTPVQLNWAGGSGSFRLIHPGISSATCSRFHLRISRPQW